MNEGGERKGGLPTWGWVLIGLGAVTLLGCVPIGLLALFLVPTRITEELGVAQQAVAHTRVQAARAACEAYAVEHGGVYPDSLLDLEVAGYGTTSDWEDPWGRPLVYEPPDPAQGRLGPLLGSYGADGEPGGTGPDQDVGFE